MTKIRSLFILILMSTLIITLTACQEESITPPPPIDENLEDLGEYGKVKLAFLLTNDIHFSSIHDEYVKFYYPNALIDAKRQTGDRLHAVVVNGDFSEGFINDYDTLIDLTKTHGGVNLPLLVSYGNHEGNNKHYQYEEKFKQPVDNVKEVNGYSFITVGAHANDTYLQSQNEWLSQKLDDAVEKDPTKPVFTYIHHPVKDTTFGSEGNPTLRSALASHRQSFAFFAHNHRSFGNHTLWQGEFIAYENSYMKSEVKGQYSIVRVTDKNFIIIQKYEIYFGNETPVYLGDDYIIDYNAFLLEA